MPRTCVWMRVRSRLQVGCSLLGAVLLTAGAVYAWRISLLAKLRRTRRSRIVPTTSSPPHTPLPATARTRARGVATAAATVAATVVDPAQCVQEVSVLPAGPHDRRKPRGTNSEGSAPPGPPDGGVAGQAGGRLPVRRALIRVDATGDDAVSEGLPSSQVRASKR
jgi:hypothetical protein